MKEYRLWEAIGDIDEKLILEANNFDEESAKKKKRASRIKMFAGISAAACFVIAVASVLANVNQMPQTGNLPSNNVALEEDLPTPAVKSAYDENNTFYEGVKLNRGEEYSIDKSHGKLKVTTKKKFEKEFDFAGLNVEDADAYYMSGLSGGGCMYGIIKMNQSNLSFDKVMVSKNVVLDEVYDDLEKTAINGVDMALGFNGRMNDLGEAHYYAMFKAGEVSFTIDGKEQTLTEFIHALSEIINSYEK